ncbi:putative 4-hydroxy-2-oxoglutarate aldolase, mitochondrial [Friedmanniomyces simplex]|uniref:Putative 4-hydroxy-2-oxoglutarate aldolase, mitochondrial n=1 Tax=Friedmanniomyces simplex TaxID=329884 RepID=A0A4U0WV30_9PEZI|nr:putative 4-hydroxy-2-oxoglutarate aldolase, mitochondrial [Friedmanniomyces simplex]
MNGQNGHTSSSVPAAGVWAPAITFFDPETDELDLDSQAKYYKYLSQHLTGLVILGTNAETFLLTREERAALLKTAREAVGPEYPIMAGVGGHSTKQVLEYINDAAEAKANYALVLPCAYFGKATTAKVITNFYDEVAAKSPLPIVIYNFPGVCNGIDIESDTMAALAHKHPNVVGVKLTCASVGKITRLAADFSNSRFAIFGGQSDFLLGGMAVGSAGCIAAFANVFPKSIKRIYDLYREGKHEEAMKMHRVAALAESLSKSGIANTKFAASLTSARSAGVEGAEEKLRPRRPYEAPSAEVKEGIRGKMKEMMGIEESL